MSIPLDNEQISRFQMRVYQALLKIPPGKVITYQELGNLIDCASAQAIGQALKKNPYAPEIPCHRVIKSNLMLGGYQGKTEGKELTRKLELLANEGVLFDEGRKLQDSSKVWNPETP